MPGLINVKNDQDKAITFIDHNIASFEQHPKQPDLKTVVKTVDGKEHTVMMSHEEFTNQFS